MLHLEVLACNRTRLALPETAAPRTLPYLATSVRPQLPFAGIPSLYFFFDNHPVSLGDKNRTMILSGQLVAPYVVPDAIGLRVGSERWAYEAHVTNSVDAAWSTQASTLPL